MKKFLKGAGIALAALIAVPLGIGFVTRVTMSEVPPPGQLFDIGGFRLHLDCQGKKGTRPTVIIEAGAASPTPNYHWLQALLMDEARVCRYDRAGLGWSDDSETPRDADTITDELHRLLAAADIKPPYVMAGHSLGGPLMRVYADNYPGEVVGMVFIDATHPDQFDRMGISQEMMNSSRSTFTLLKVLGGVGLLPHLYSYSDDGDPERGLPKEAAAQMQWINRNGRAGSEGLKESRAIPAVLDRARQTTDFGNMPIRVYTAGYVDTPQVEALKEQGVDISLHEAIQKDLAALSTQGLQVVLPNATHTSINSDRANARIIAREISSMLDAADQSSHTQRILAERNEP